MYRNVERVDSCEYSIGIIIAPLKENIAGINFFGNEHTKSEKSLKKWMTASFLSK